MPTVYYPSPADAEVIEIEFLKPAGGARSIRLLVDSGFTGTSSLVLPEGASDLIQAEVPGSHATGALQGDQDRAWVSCHIPELGFRKAVIAIIADTAALSLPTGVEGMAGLSFLRHFSGWGAERTEDADWQFSLTYSER